MESVKSFLKWKREFDNKRKRERDKSIGKRIVQYCVGLTFVTGLSTLIVYANHGWTWPSEINGVTLSVPEFVVTVALLTLVAGICIDVWRSRKPQSSNEKR
jgi:hypothetical protein